MLEKIRRFMQGRYGIDAFGIFIFILSCVCNLILSIFFRAPKWGLLELIPMALLVYALFRILSRNVNRRSGENRAFLALMEKVKSFIERIKTYKYKRDSIKKDTTHKYFKCKKCKQQVRVPVGKGKIKITCPKCGEKFIKKT